MRWLWKEKLQEMRAETEVKYVKSNCFHKVSWAWQFHAVTKTMTRAKNIDTTVQGS